MNGLWGGGPCALGAPRRRQGEAAAHAAPDLRVNRRVGPRVTPSTRPILGQDAGSRLLRRPHDGRARLRGLEVGLEEEVEERRRALIPTPARFAFAFGRPDILAERQAERLAKWQWSDEFLAKARPDKGNYGQGDLFDDGLTKLERAQIEQGREAYLTGGAKLRYKRLTGQI